MSVTPAIGDRSLFPKLEASVYVSHSAVAPASLPVVAAVGQVLDDYARLGVSAFMVWAERKEEIRAALARLIGAPRSADVGITSGTTKGITAIAQGLPWSAGDGLVIFEGEFPANTTPWLMAAKQHGLKVHVLKVADYLDDHGIGLQRLEDTLKNNNIRLVAVSAVQFANGLAMPIAQMTRLCHDYGARIAVDGIQALGIVPVDVAQWGVDFLTGGAHKWLMGLEGAGFIYARPEAAASLRPHLAGWLSHEAPVDFLFNPGLNTLERPLRQGIDAVEGSSASTVSLAAMGAGVAMIEGLGVQRIYEHVNHWLDAFEPRAVSLGWGSLRSPSRAGRSGILALTPPAGRTATEAAAFLGERGVVVTAPDGLLRVAPHWPNALSEVEVVAALLADFGSQTGETGR